MVTSLHIVQLLHVCTVQHLGMLSKIHFCQKHKNLHLTDHLDNLQIVHTAYHGANLDEDPDFPGQYV